MNGATFICEFHPWRGISHTGGGLLRWTTIGFVTVAFVPFLLSVWLRTKLDGMKNALKPKRFPDSDVFGDYPRVPHELRTRK